MIDVILFTFYAVTFAGGFWCGKTFGSLTSMVGAAKTKVRSWL